MFVFVKQTVNFTTCTYIFCVCVLYLHASSVFACYFHRVLFCWI